MPDAGSSLTAMTDSSLYGDGSDVNKSRDHDASSAVGVSLLIANSSRNDSDGGSAYSDAQKAALWITVEAMTAATRWMQPDISTLRYWGLGLGSILGLSVFFNVSTFNLRLGSPAVVGCRIRCRMGPLWRSLLPVVTVLSGGPLVQRRRLLLV
ncbi:hypothetical protein EDB89DRAFT_1080702 [Lactarius sanguifluus]|nr:hypothetical protein EDB89DRAFT_1080702 [Lactarius sanguifluus]